MSKKRERRDPAYIREQGTRGARQKTGRKISFSLLKHLPDQGQTAEDWEKCGLMAKLWQRLRFVSQYSTQEVLQKEYIKRYTKVDFPPNSKFKEPKHIINVEWAVMHITNNSKEVVIGYIEDDIFYIVFLDKNHDFWPINR